MPIYEYRCTKCSSIFERLELRVMEIPTSQCPSCMGVGVKVISRPGIIFELFENTAYRLPDYDKKMKEAYEHDKRVLQILPPMPHDKGKDIRTYDFDFDRAKRDKIERLAEMSNIKEIGHG